MFCTLSFGEFLMYIAQKLPVSLKTDIYPKTNPLGVCDTAKLPLGRVEEALPGALPFPTPSSPQLPA